MPVYERLASFASESRPDVRYEVSTEGTRLSCNCPGWTRQTHYRGCRAIEGRGCTCSQFTSGPKDWRTCKHVRQAAPFVFNAGGLQAAARLVREGRLRSILDLPGSVGRFTTAAPGYSAQQAQTPPARRAAVRRPVPPPASTPAVEEGDYVAQWGASRAIRIREEEE